MPQHWAFGRAFDPPEERTNREMQPAEARERVLRAIQEVESLLHGLVRILDECEQLRTLADTAQRDCERLRAEVSQLQAEMQRYRSERKEISHSLSQASELLSQLQRRLAESLPPLLKVLLIDDDGTVREAVARMLAVQGHSVIQASGGREGLARLEAGEPVDLVLTDLRMPDMSGWEVAQAVKARWPHLRVILLTGTPEALPEHKERTVDLVLAKPVTLEALRYALSRARA